MTLKEKILKRLHERHGSDRVVWIPTVGVSVEAMKKVDATWPDSHFEPVKLARAAAATFELTGLPCCTVPFCLTVEAEALGGGLDRGSLNTQPQIMEHLEVELGEYELAADFLERGRIPVVLEAISLLAKSQRDIQPVNVKVTGPFTISTSVFGAERILLATIEQPEDVKRVLEMMTRVSIGFAKAAVAAGADVVTISDPVASGDLLSAEQYAEFAAPYERQVFAAIDAPAVLHICGYTRDEMPHIRDVGTWGFSFEEKVAVRDARAILGERVAAIGNVSPVKFLLNGTPEEVRRQAEQCFEDGIDLLSSGCAVPPLTKLENLRALAAAAA
jgi:[methyl-Co(III) methanol-specific corrinoid protein]:coenzyme M methyltransferase